MHDLNCVKTALQLCVFVIRGTRLLGRRQVVLHWRAVRVFMDYKSSG